MADKRLGYKVHRRILDETAVEEIAEKSETTLSLSEKVKKSVR